jgi:hypothetical protein
MEPYKDRSENSGVTAYETSDESITVEFNHDAIYRYTYASTGKRKIEKMKKLAREGKGLSTYISQTVREKFETKLK